MMIVDIPESCSRDRLTVASSRPNAAAAAAVTTVMTTKARQVRRERQAEDGRAPQEHHR